MALLDRILRAGEGKKVKALASLVPDINAFEPEFNKLSDQALQAKPVEFRQRLERGEDVDDLMVEAFAVVREASLRVIGQRHFDVQLMGGAALHAGWIPEMRTGEGKTLESTCEKTISLIGAAKTERITKESTTTATGLRMTNRAVCAHLPSSFGVIELFLTTNLSILFPRIASNAGNATKAPRTAMITTVTPA